ncbi:glycoside hydrolase family 3 protein [Flagellimonas sp. CMM7]|uniref:glycoside hydrolase family 3 protein n=1 Tax=Flagellimonas sp. CMM7 TaxID=2654676 RepID=UPI0013D31D18|nr:glycoside hydrolase family 3 protein [Flagellimonas sp. CMM7]UII78995.1 glycoside hydrolase family 3 protein [Flagellimonas sp. CMM7]
MHNSLLPYSSATKKLTLKQKVGQLFMPAAFINDSEEEVLQIEDLISTNNIGAICFFHSRASAATNFEGKKKVVYNDDSYARLRQLISRYQKAANFPLLIAIDAEWGLAMRIEKTAQYPYAITLGAIQGNHSLVFEVGKQIATDCKEAGVHWNLAPVVDINNNPENPVIGYRSFGDDKNLVLTKAEAYIKGMESIGTLGALKHFPGHGDTATDSHLGLPIINKSKQELKKNELYPYQKLIEKGVDAVMVGHLSIPELDSGNPSTTSSKIITDLLRTDMGFESVIISDALNMHAVSKKYSQKGMLEANAFTAGMDMMCFSEYSKEGIEEIMAGASEKRIEESFKRVWRLKEQAFSDNHKNENPNPQSPSELNRKIAQHSITELYGSPGDIKEIKSNDFINLSLNNLTKNSFSSKIEKNGGQKHHQLEMSTIELIGDKVSEHKNVVLALFPPSIKPKNKFGIDEGVLEFIQSLISQKNVLIYLFGNPYVLDILKLKSNSNIVVVYQDFAEFQEVAFHHFIGQTKAKGKLPITLKTFQV